MLATGKRPRELHWFHAGAMLFGDWGTSRLYVLGLAFFYTGHAAIWFMAAMSGLLLLVAWAYNLICRAHPDGGGVYSSAKSCSQTLAVIGALLLCADYLITAALSSLDAFHYLDIPRPELFAALSMLVIGVVNFFGPRKAGTLAFLVAISTVLLTAIIAGASLPELPQAHLATPAGSPVRWWTQFVSLILAISGVEAIANMTGIMVRPVSKTSRRSIWPVVGEIVILNIILTLAMSAVPAEILGDGSAAAAQTAHRDDMLRVLAEYYVGPTFAAGASCVFAFLLLSAANTAITDLVNIQFMLAVDRELPSVFGGLNRFGMPLIPLLMATMAPIIVVLLVPDIGALADLYAIGVVGAVAINLWTTAGTKELPFNLLTRRSMLALALFMIAVWVTIAVEKPHALFFAGIVVLGGLTARLLVRHRATAGVWVGRALNVPLTPLRITERVRPEVVAITKQRVLVPTQGNPKLVSFAIQEAKAKGCELMFLYVRQIAVSSMGSSLFTDPQDDPQAALILSNIAKQAQNEGVTVHTQYATAWSIAAAILECAEDYRVQTVMLGTSQRGALWQMMKGDVIQEVASCLPGDVTLLIHA